jgi:hypothetical protein
MHGPFPVQDMPKEGRMGGPVEGTAKRESTTDESPIEARMDESHQPVSRLAATKM